MDRSQYYYFEKEWVWKRIDYDKAFWYQCVDLIKQYMYEVLWISPGKTGNANEMWTNKYGCFDKMWTQITWTKDLMQGDIIFSLNGPTGHVAIVDRIVNGQIQVLEQNGSGQNSGNWLGANAIRLHTYSPSFFVWVWRCEKIFENLQKERSYCDVQIKTTQDYKASIRYQE